MLTRLHPAFHPAGGYAACLAQTTAGPVIECWDLTGATPRPRTVERADRVDIQPVPGPDGRVLVAGNGGTGPRLTLAGGAADLPLPAASRGVRLLPSPDPDVLAVVLVALLGGGTAVGLVDRCLRIREVLSHPGGLSGGLWLDAAGSRLSLLSMERGAARTVAVDLRTGSVGELTGLRPADRLLSVDSWHGRALLAVPGPRGRRLAVAPLDRLDAARPAAALNALTGAVQPLAWDPGGRYLAVRVNRGVRSVLLCHDPDRDTVTELDLPAGLLGSRAVWSARGLRITFSTPTIPTTVGTVTVAPDGLGARLTVPPTNPTSSAGPANPTEPADRPAVDARCEWLTGPAGDQEAVVYGGSGWRDAKRLVVALHGGPEDAWRLGYDPLFQRLAGTGCAVVAVNQRGSTGYGPAHRDALVGAWGVPDLADVRHLLDDTTAYRRHRGLPAASLYGISYGAFLALLVVAVGPESVDRVAVVAPFLSARALYEQAAPPVRAMMDRLDARRDATDAIGVRDVARLLGDQPLPPLLVLHGVADPLVPVEQSRKLRRLLTSRGARDGLDISYREFPTAGHDLLTDTVPTTGPHPLDLLVDFLTGTRPTAGESRLAHTATAPPAAPSGPARLPVAPLAASPSRSQHGDRQPSATAPGGR